MTEHEAGTKWCPFARADNLNGTPVNRSSDNSVDGDCFCIASDCMAWRWTDHEKRGGYCGLVNK